MGSTTSAAAFRGQQSDPECRAHQHRLLEWLSLSGAKFGLPEGGSVSRGFGQFARGSSGSHPGLTKWQDIGTEHGQEEEEAEEESRGGAVRER